jgi:hypothetical protein
VVGPLVAAGLLVPWLRHLRPLVALVVGEVLGWAPWVVEAYTRFGGPWQRLRAAEQAGPRGLDADGSLLRILPRLLDGRPNYCCFERPVSAAGPLPLAHTSWLIAVTALALLGLLLVGRHRRTPLVLVVIPALLLAAFYLLLPSFVSPRFLLPVLALLSLPLAVTLVTLARAGRGRWRWATAAVVVAVMLTHVWLMLPVAAAKLERERVAEGGSTKITQALRPVVADRRCLLVGRNLLPAGYELRCQVRGQRALRELPELLRQATAEGRSVIVVVPERPARKSYLSTWEAPDVPGMPRRSYVYVPPR